MIWPVKNRLHDDESGLLTLLMKMGVALVWLLFHKLRDASDAYQGSHIQRLYGGAS